jgi:CRISPR-associated DxTHG motif protein
MIHLPLHQRFCKLPPRTPPPRIAHGIPLHDPQVSKRDLKGETSRARPGPLTHGFRFMEVVLTRTLSESERHAARSVQLA